MFGCKLEIEKSCNRFANSILGECAELNLGYQKSNLNNHSVDFRKRSFYFVHSWNSAISS